jgi:hypothetical protein
MKQNTFTKILAAGAACALAVGTTLAQSSTTTVTTGGSDVSTTTSASTMDGTGTITAFTPSSDYITFSSQTSTAPVKYYVSKQTTVVDPTGQTVELSALRPDMPVRYTYVKEGDRMIITKVTLEKPISYYKKETTTTTTTSP